MATIANDRPPPDHPERPEHDAIEWAGVEMILTRIESLCWSTLLSSKVTELKRRLEPNWSVLERDTRIEIRRIFADALQKMSRVERGPSRTSEIIRELVWLRFRSRI